MNYVCICVSVGVCLYASVDECMCMCEWVRVYLGTCVCRCVYLCVWLCMCANVGMYG